MGIRVDTARFLEGWANRLRLGRDLIKGSGEPGADFLPEDCVSNAALLALNAKSLRQIPTSLHVARVVLSFRTVNEQLRFISQFDNSATKLTAPLTVGSIFSSQAAQLTNIPSEDYSLVCLAAVLANENASDVWAQLQAAICDLLDDLGASQVDGFASMRQFAEAFGLKPSQPESLRDISGVAFQLKQSRWALIGADLLSLIQALCDPLHQLSVQQIEAGYKLAGPWRMDVLLAKLVLMRAFGGYQAEREFYLRSRAAFGKLGRSVIRIADYVIAPKSENSAEIPPYLKGFGQSDTANQLLSFSANVALATKRGQLPILKPQILSMYNVDSSSPFFLDWHSIHTSFLLPASEADLSSIFLKSIMSSTTVGRRFFSVALGRGKGQLVADLSSYVTRLRSGRDLQGDAGGRPVARGRTKGTYDFVRGMRTLPQNVRNALMEEVLEKGMMERLAFAFPTSLTLPDAGITRADNQASLLRIELANLARRETVLNERKAFRIIEEETQHLRMLKFHTFFKAGRVKVDWDYLVFIVANYLERRFELLTSSKSETALNTLVFKNVVDLISQEITDTLLFDSEASLDQALSNNLRHGVIVPRFLRAINDSLSATAEGVAPLADFNEAAQSRFGKNASTVLKLREEIVKAVNRFKDYWLTIDRSGAFSSQTKEMVAQKLLDVAGRQDSVDAWTIAETIVDSFRSSVEAVIAEMLAAFSNEVQPVINGAILRTHQHESVSSSSRLTSFLDSLEANIRVACEEVAGWLGLSKFAMDVDDFDIMDLIRFESSSFILSDFRKLNVRYMSFDKSGGRLTRKPQAHRFKGAYFEAIQEIVHNLISNAFKYSGLKVSTEVVFSVIVDGNDLVFRCENSFAQAGFEAVVAERENGLKVIRQERPEQAQDEDVLSGFHKIKNVCSRVFGQDVVINIPPISPKLKRFMVEITVEGAVGDALA